MRSGVRSRESVSAARVATLVVFFLIAAIALFSDVDRTRVGMPSVAFGPDYTAVANTM